MKFSQWFDTFFKVNCDDVISYSCSKEYSIINRKHFYLIANKELQDIKPIDVQMCIKTAISYSSSRQRKVYYLLHKVMQEALINDLIDNNVVDKVRPPKLKRCVMRQTATTLRR